jgi:hypothetical protein
MDAQILCSKLGGTTPPVRIWWCRVLETSHSLKLIGYLLPAWRPFVGSVAETLSHCMHFSSCIPILAVHKDWHICYKGQMCTLISALGLEPHVSLGP